MQQFGLTQTQIPVLMATLGKALGSSGAFVAGSDDLIETLIQQARPYIYTTASLPAIAAATMCSLDLLHKESWRREKLTELIEYFKHKSESVDLEFLNSDTAIQPIVIGSNERTLELAEVLKQAGILVTAIRPPTVPQGSARLRVTLSAEHETTDIDRLFQCLQRA